MTIDPLCSRERIVIGDRPHISDAMKRRVWDRDGGVCYLCGEPVPIDGPSVEWEHRLPRGLLGEMADREENLSPAHKACHAIKTKADIARIAHAKRQEKLTRPKEPSRRPIRSRGFQTDGPKRKIQSRPFPKRPK